MKQCLELVKENLQITINNMKKKNFSIGVRIEHKQSLINLSQYGKEFDKNLPSADYKLVEHLSNGTEK